MLNINDNENKLITIALARTGGNRTEAAKLLGISVRNLQYKIRKRTEKDNGEATAHRG